LVSASPRHRIARLTSLLRRLALSVSLSLILTLSHADARQDYLNDSLQSSCGGGRAAEVKKLLARGAQINARFGSSALGSAINQRHTDIALVLIAKGASVNAPGYRGNTPLIDAAQSGEVEVVKALLKAGADPNLADSSGVTPLAWAAMVVGIAGAVCVECILLSADMLAHADELARPK
jgi:ankyrin repeat protein